MTTVIVDYSELNSARREARDVARETENHSDFLKNKIKNKLMGITGNNITDAVASVNKKINTLDKKTIKFSELSNKIQNYKSIVETKDEQVAIAITKVTDAFASKNGIKVSGLAKAITKFVLDAVNDSALGRLVKDVLNRIKTVLKSIKEAIENSLKMGIGKYIKDIIVSTVAIVIAIGVTIVTGGAGIVGIAAIIGGIITVANGGTNIWNSIKAIQCNKNDPAWAHKHGKIDKLSDSLRVLNNPGWNIVAGIVDLAEITTGVIGGIDGIAGVLKSGGGKLVDNFKSIKNLFRQDGGMITKRLFEFNVNKDILVRPEKFMNGLKSIKGDQKFINGLKHNGKLLLSEMKGKGGKFLEALKKPSTTVELMKNNLVDIRGKINIGNVSKLDKVKDGLIGKHINLNAEIMKIGSKTIKVEDLIKTSIKVENIKGLNDFAKGIKDKNGKLNVSSIIKNDLLELNKKTDKLNELLKKVQTVKFN